MSEQVKKPQEIQINMPQDVQSGVYANQVAIAHTQEEFVLDFILTTPPVGIVNSRVIVSAGHAKRIATALMENVAKYEATFGKIESPKTVKPQNTTEH